MTFAFLIIAIIGVLGLLLALGGQLLFPLAGERAQRLTVTCSDGWELAVWHRPSKKKRYAEPVLLCHGLANNHRIFEFQPPVSLAVALSEAGFDTYAVDLRGSGDSWRRPKTVRRGITIDDHILLDVPAVVKAARERSGGARVLYVGHSMGGIVGLAAADAAGQEQLAGIVTLGTPLFFASLERRTRAALAFGVLVSRAGRIPLTWIARLGLPLAGIAPARLIEGMANARNFDGATRRRAIAHMVAPVARGVLLQFDDWIRHDAFRSVDRSIDYRVRLQNLHVPLLVVGGSVDKLAPRDAVEKAFAMAGSKDKTLIIDGPDGLTYGHGDLLIGRDAPLHFYPRIIAWLDAHATKV